jgi:hypothetical protein
MVCAYDPSYMGSIGRSITGWESGQYLKKKKDRRKEGKKRKEKEKEALTFLS